VDKLGGDLGLGREELMSWLETHWKVFVVGFLMLVTLALLGLWAMERRDKHVACVEALKSREVGDLARHLLCTQ
jgi:hypothetical protein